MSETAIHQGENTNLRSEHKLNPFFSLKISLHCQNCPKAKIIDSGTIQLEKFRIFYGALEIKKKNSLNSVTLEVSWGFKALEEQIDEL